MSPESSKPRPIGHSIQHFPSLDSTNRLAASLAVDPANHGLVILADAQTAGRGQYQRVWQAPPRSSILMSVVLFPPPELRRPAILTAWAAVSVCAMIRQAIGQSATIKWPNDVLIGGRKICGILCEGGASHVIAGIGVNVNQTAADFEAMALPDASSLSICAGQILDMPGLTRQLIQQLDTGYDWLLSGEWSALEAEWQGRIGLLGKPVAVERMDGTELHGLLRALSFGGVEISAGDGKTQRIAPEAIRHLRASDS